MLVMDVTECDLISFSLGSSRIFALRRDDAWLRLALQRLQHLQTAYISQGKPPPPDALKHDFPEIHRKFFTATVEAMQRISRQQHEEVQSAVQRAAMSQPFLDNACNDDADDRKAAVGKRAPTLILLKHLLCTYLAFDDCCLRRIGAEEGWHGYRPRIYACQTLQRAFTAHKRICPACRNKSCCGADA